MNECVEHQGQTQHKERFGYLWGTSQKATTFLWRFHVTNARIMSETLTQQGLDLVGSGMKQQQ